MTGRRAGRGSPPCAPNWPRRGLDGFVLFRADRHQNEYVPACDERLAWLTAFTGSAGAAIVLAAEAAVFRRRPLHPAGAEQVDVSLFEIAHLTDTPPDKWIGPISPPATRLGYDPWLRDRRRRRTAGQGLRQGRRDAGAGRAQPDRCRVAATARPQPLAPSSCTSERSPAKRRRQARPHRGELASCAPTLWSSPIRMRLCWTVQHSRRRCRPHAAGAGIRAGAEGRSAVDLVDGRKLGNSVRAALAATADCASRRAFTGDLRRLRRRQRRCASTRRPRPTRSRG